MTTLFSDAFGGGSGVSVQSYSAGYHLITGYSSSLYVYDGVVRTTDGSGAASYGYYNDDIDPFADGIVSIDYVCHTVLPTAFISVTGRCQVGSATFMMLLYDTSAATLQIAKRVNNSQTLLGSPVSFSMTPSTTQRFGLKMDGDQFSGLVDGVEVVPPVTDTTISAAGYPGFRRYDTSPTTATTGIHYDNLSADTLDAGTPDATATGGTGVGTGSGSGGDAIGASGGNATATGGTGTGTGSGSGGDAVGVTAGTITVGPLENSPGFLWLNQAVVWTWTPNGRVGAMEGLMPIDGSGTTDATTGELLVSGLAAGDGQMKVSIWGATPADDIVYFEYGTVT